MSENYPFEATTAIGGVTLDEIPGKAFNRWTLIDTTQKDADGQAIGERLSFPMPDETVAYRAVYDDLVYNVAYDYTGTVPDGAPSVPTDNASYAFGSSVNAADVPTMAGYTFDGWKLGEVKTTGFTIDADTPVTVSGTLTRIITLTGSWVKNGDVNITYTSGFNDENAPDESLKFIGRDTCTKGLDYTLKNNDGFTNYSYPGYAFSGWKVISETVSPNPTGFFARLYNFFFVRNTFAVGSVYNEGDTIPALNSSITVEAVWTQNPPEPEKYRVTYDGNGSTSGNVPEDKTEYSSGDNVTVLSNGDLAKEGYTFKGWNTKADGKGTTYQPSDTFRINGNTTLYAVWKKNGDSNTDQDKPNPGTGESVWPIVLAAVALMLSCGMAFTVLYRRRAK